MTYSSNPLMPGIYDVAWLLFAVASVVLLVIALVSIGRNVKGLSPVLALLWTALTLLIPVFGPIAWLIVGRRTASA